MVEGEGYIGWHKKSRTPVLTVTMGDKDTVHKIGRLVNQKVNSAHVKTENRKPMWSVTIQGRRCIGWLFTIYRFLGKRRQSKVNEVVREWKLHPARPTATRRHAAYEEEIW